MSDYDKEIEEAFETYWHGTFAGMSDNDYIKYKNVGKSGTSNGFIAGAKWQKEKDAARIKTLEEVVDMQAAMIEGMRRVVAVARMINSQRADVRMDHALRDYDRCKIKKASGTASRPENIG